MANPSDSDPSHENSSSNPANPDPLQNFVDGLSGEIGSEFGRISSHDEKREVKREIARQLGMEEAWAPEIRSSVDNDENTFLARVKVSARYNELLSEGRIVEAGEVAEQTKRFNEWLERIDAHVRGEECFYSEDIPHADWVQGKPSDNRNDGV
ncbi:hypothetical protein [Salinibacter sp.]|uniref:hypothetical protein n=1 Tax=Salinibacter sp. TaxID=2065818 RepID=UPI0021E887C1|nr:hypothetical protein [Salinibacter sp.]